MPARLRRVALVLTLIAAASGCATLDRVPRPTAAIPTREVVAALSLHGSTLELHVAAPVGMPWQRPLVLFASGDGGWFGTAVGMFRAIGDYGYPAVGFSARAFLRIERPPHAALDQEQLARDYGAILAAARQRLRLPTETPVVLTGWSRGGAFAVLAAAARGRPASTSGVVALGLAEGEDLRIDGPGGDTDDGADGDVTTAPAAWPFLPYALLRQGVSVPSVVIQASGDDYLPARMARTAFGPDRPLRRFIEVAGRNHRFAGAEPALVEALGAALTWIGEVVESPLKGGEQPPSLSMDVRR